MPGNLLAAWGALLVRYSPQLTQQMPSGSHAEAVAGSYLPRSNCAAQPASGQHPMDHNEAACGACRRIGELICCEGCVAAFHCRCAGYDNASEVPEGDWHCWFCAKNKGIKYQHPKALFKAPRSSQTHVMLAMDDDHLDKFYRCQVLAISEGYVELKFLDIQRDSDIVHRSSNRLWHGAIDKNTWSIEADGVTWRPNSRLLELDTDAPGTARPQHQQGTSRDSRPQTTNRPAVKAGGVERVPEGEVGAGLPVIRGGAGQEEFTPALNGLWSNLLGSGYPDRMPQCLLMPGYLVEPWYLWREVWAWGGPEAITENKLWATVGFSFNVPFTSSAASSRIKRSYDTLIAPLDQAIDAGDVQLQRPTKCRLPKHRALQIRAAIVPGGPSAAASVPVKRAGSGQGRGRPRKRKRGAWSSSDDDEAAPDYASDNEDEDMSDVAPGSAEDSSQEDGSDQEEEDQGSSEADDDRGSPPAKQARTVASTQAPSGGAVRRVQLVDTEVMGRISLTPAAEGIKVGQLVDFRRFNSADNSASGWRSGIVIAIESGSSWEGGRWLLIRPCQHHHQQHTNTTHDQQAEAALKLLAPGGHMNREVAALMAVPARPGSPAAAQATAAGSTAAVAGGGGAGVAVADQTTGADDDKPTWVPMVWRGSYSSPLPRPVVMVRQHFTPALSVAAAGQLASAGGSETLKATPHQQLQGAGVSSAATTAANQQQAGDRQQSVSSLHSAPGVRVQQLSAGTAVEVLRDGSWWPAKVMAVKSAAEDTGSPAAAAPSLSEDPSSSQGAMSVSGSAAAGVGCVVLRNDDPPEADGAVWRCSRGHAMRLAHPQQSSGYGMLVSKPEDLMPLPVLRKQLQPYTYAGNIQAFSCLHHMKPELSRA